MNFEYEEHWKEYNNNDLSHSETHYLLALYSLSKQKGELRAVDLAKELDVSRNAVSLQLKKLIEKKLVLVNKNFLKLTKQGKAKIETIANKRQTMIVFLMEVLGVSEATAKTDSCKVEHLLSDDTGEALLKFVQFLRSDRKVVLDFLKQFQRFYLQCDPDINCGLCENIHKMESSDV